MTADRRRFVLDLVATIVIVATCGALVWAAYGRTGPEPPAMAALETPVSLEGAATRGAADAPVAIVMFTDYQCPYCARFERATLAAIDRDYIQTGRVRLAVRHLPLEAIHPVAFAAAVAATCADRQGRFWDLHASLFEHQKRLAPDVVPELAQAAGLDMDAFAVCAGGDDAAARVRADLESAAALGLTGTPAFLIGRVGEDGYVTVAAVVAGAQPADEFSEVVNGLLDDGTRRFSWTAAAAALPTLLGAWLIWIRRSSGRRGLKRVDGERQSQTGIN